MSARRQMLDSANTGVTYKPAGEYSADEIRNIQGYLQSVDKNMVELCAASPRQQEREIQEVYHFAGYGRGSQRYISADRKRIQAGMYMP